MKSEDKTVAIETVGNHDSEAYHEADENFDRFMKQLREKREEYQKLHEEDGLWTSEIERLNHLIESDKVVNLHESGTFFIEMKLKTETEIMSTDWDVKDFRIVGLDINVKDMKLKLQVKPV